MLFELLAGTVAARVLAGDSLVLMRRRPAAAGGG
jgi:hypothetical protein